MKKILAFALSLACSLPTVAAFAATGGAPDSTIHSSATIEGKTYRYTARAGTITLQDQNGKPTVRMFYTADTLDGAAPGSRPVTFFYNGGPGSASLWLRMGAFGPRRVQLNGTDVVPPAPYHLVNNDYSLLDKTDLVFIDMPGTGFGRLVGSSKPADFNGVDKDMKAFGQFIQRYITTFHRWNSPKFLFGESYGTTRSAVLVDYLQGEGVQINGVVLLSSILNYGLMGDRIAGGDWEYVLYLPSLAAAAWYFHATPYHPTDLSSLLSEVEHFATTEYLDALARGSTLPASESQDVVEKLHQYLGISPQYIRNSNLRIPYDHFEAELRRDSGKIIGRFDARFESYTLDRTKASADNDPVDAAIDAAFIATNNEYLRDELHYNTTLPYRTFAEQTDHWDFKHNDQLLVNAAADLADALTENPHLRVFSANGYYDFATPFFSTIYTLEHLNIDPALQDHISYGFYPSGHMVYLNTEALPQFKRDLARWYDDTLR